MAISGRPCRLGREAVTTIDGGQAGAGARGRRCAQEIMKRIEKLTGARLEEARAAPSTESEEE
jgi:molybdenum-dependent DNA-binding transcriptional regulator ModE